MIARPPFPLRGQNCQCRGCGLLFRRTSSFDRHRYGPSTDRRCYTEKQLVEKGWKTDSKGFWRQPGPKLPVTNHRINP